MPLGPAAVLGEERRLIEPPAIVHDEQEIGVDDRVARLQGNGAAISLECLVIAPLNVEQAGDVIPGSAGFWRPGQDLLIGSERVADALQTLQADGATVSQPQVRRMPLQTVAEDLERLIRPSLFEKDAA